MSPLRRLLLPLLFAALALSAAGCHHSGPASITGGRAKFNDAIQQTNGEQLLGNIVRLRYRDSPYFMQVASVSVGMEMGVTGGGSGTFPEIGTNVYGANVGASYKEKPTVTYTPLQGEQFVTQLLTPVSETTVALLVNSGWSVSRVFRLLLQDINGLENARSATGPTPLDEPRFRRFREAVDHLRTLERRGLCSLGYATAEGHNGTPQPSLVLSFAAEAEGTEELSRFRQLLGLPADRLQYSLGINHPGSDITAASRSLMGAFFYLSQGVVVPRRDQQAGRVTITRAASGEPFDWLELTSDLIEIRSAYFRPSGAHTAVQYRGVWFYIDDADLDSKSTFVLLQQVFALQAGEMRSMGPILTLPVAQ